MEILLKIVFGSAKIAGGLDIAAKAAKMKDMPTLIGMVGVVLSTLAIILAHFGNTQMEL